MENLSKFFQLRFKLLDFLEHMNKESLLAVVSNFAQAKNNLLNTKHQTLISTPNPSPRQSNALYW